MYHVNARDGASVCSSCLIATVTCQCHMHTIDAHIWAALKSLGCARARAWRARAAGGSEQPRALHDWWRRRVDRCQRKRRFPDSAPAPADAFELEPSILCKMEKRRRRSYDLLGLLEHSQKELWMRWSAPWNKTACCDRERDPWGMLLCGVAPMSGGWRCAHSSDSRGDHSCRTTHSNSRPVSERWRGREEHSTSYQRRNRPGREGPGRKRSSDNVSHV